MAKKQILKKMRTAAFAALFALMAVASPYLTGQAFAADYYVTYCAVSGDANCLREKIESSGTKSKARGMYTVSEGMSEVVNGLLDSTTTDQKYKTPYTNKIEGGYIFTGWKKDNSGDLQQPGKALSEISYHKSYTLVAQWKEVSLNGSRVASTNPIAILDTARSATAGTVKVEQAQAKTGTDVKFTVTPSTGYRVDTVKINNATVSLTDGSYYTKTNVTDNIAAEVTFKKTYEITTAVRGGGTVSPISGTVDEGQPFDLTITPDTGWHLSVLKVNDATVNFTGSVYHIEEVNEDTDIDITFARDTHNINIYTDPGAYVDPYEDVYVEYGDDQVFVITVEPGYTITSIELDGDDVTDQLDGDQLTIYSITADMTLDVYTTADEYEVIEGDHQEVDYGDEESNPEFRFDGDLELFRVLTIDDVLVPEEEYDTASGSTIITVHHDYLLALGNGEHTAKAYYSNGNFASATFTISGAPEVPDTGLFTSFDTKLSIETAAVVVLVTAVVTFIYSSKKISRSRK